VRPIIASPALPCPELLWPEAIDRAIETIEQAPFLTRQQKRDIFYNNAARFLRLTDVEIARHHGM
jgi:uncharacterized protein